MVWTAIRHVVTSHGFMICYHTHVAMETTDGSYLNVFSNVTAWHTVGDIVIGTLIGGIVITITGIAAVAIGEVLVG